MLTLNEHAALVAEGARLDGVLLAISACIDSAYRAHGGFIGDDLLITRLSKLSGDVRNLRTMIASLPVGTPVDAFDIGELE